MLPASGNGICKGAGFVASAIDNNPTAVAAAEAAPVTTAAPAATGAAQTVANSTLGLNVRSAPAIADGNIIGFANKGDTLSVTGISADSQWYQIAYNGKTGYVYAALTLPNAAAKAAPVVK